MKIMYCSAYSDKDPRIVGAHLDSVWTYATRKPDSGLLLAVDTFAVSNYRREGLRIETWMAPHPEATDRSMKGERPDGRVKYNERISAIRNRLIDRFLVTDCDYLWFNDADQIMWPDVLERLFYACMSRRAGDTDPAVAAPVRTSTAQCWNFLDLFDSDQGVVTKRPGAVFMNDMMDGGLVRHLEVCNVTGGCWLVPRWVLEKGARYADHDLGTDAGFCLQLRDLGCPIYMDFSCRTFHHMEWGDAPLYSHDTEIHS